MRKLLLFVLFFFGGALADTSQDAKDFFNKNSCKIKSDETLICEALMCNPIGLAIPDSRSECLDVERRLVIYLATLGFWENPPKCMARDERCNRTGRATREDGSTEVILPPINTDDDPTTPPIEDPCNDGKPDPGQICQRPLNASDSTSSLIDSATDETTSLDEITDLKK